MLALYLQGAFYQSAIRLSGLHLLGISALSLVSVDTFDQPCPEMKSIQSADTDQQWLLDDSRDCKDIPIGECY